MIKPNITLSDEQREGAVEILNTLLRMNTSFTQKRATTVGMGTGGTGFYQISSTDRGKIRARDRAAAVCAAFLKT